MIKTSHTSRREGSYCVPFMEREIRHSFTAAIIILSTYLFLMAHYVENFHCVNNSWKQPFLILTPWQNSPECAVVGVSFQISVGSSQDGDGRREFQRVPGAVSKQAGGSAIGTLQCSETCRRWAGREPEGPWDGQVAPGPPLLQDFISRHAESRGLNTRSCLLSPEEILEGFGASHSCFLKRRIWAV